MRKTRILKRRRNPLNRFMISREGVITGAADDDPAGIATFLQMGATTGFSLLWLVPALLPLVSAVEEMSARVGVVTKKGLAVVLRNTYGRKITYAAALIVLICNVVTISANIAAMAEVLGNLLNINWLWLVAPLIFILLIILVGKSYSIISKYLLVSTIVLTVYIVAGFLVGPDWGEVLSATVTPVLRLDNIILLAATAFVGTTIAPYLIFWQATEEIEDKTTVKDLQKETRGVVIGFALAQLIAFFAIVTAAVVFSGQTNFIPNAAQAALSLRPIAGDLAFILFAIGILGSGIVSIPVLAASTAYVGGDALNIKSGLNFPFAQAKGFYIILIAAIILSGLLVFTNTLPMLMLFYSQVLNGVLTPVLIILLMLITNNRKIMGKYTNGFWSNLFGVASIVLMLGLDIALLVTYL
ncbi:hypothetical protein DRH29_01030 [candidate division Kazan bacterium]|uniref:Divalent metal cation transporter n=1 Tax=candidate division Kazan bacterium TaxID=2202143 RepID=A0A420ZDH4_UNCK3|nr:MAG: hypothetical protein DRH29_01030 [candidate division Kazan bacterium]